MRTDALKDQARRHEQREDWAKALETYAKVVENRRSSEDPDIALYNRIGDLHIRLGNVEEAVGSYETAIDFYVEAELPNNAVAICRKIIRNDPARADAFLRLGRLRAEQGFVVEARENFLSFAELMQGRGKSDEAFAALEEFVRLAPQDVETRLFVAEQLMGRERQEDALAHFAAAYAALAVRDEAGAEKVLERIHTIDPDHPIPDPAAPEPNVGEAADSERAGLVGFESTSLGGEEAGVSAVEEAADGGPEEEPAFSDISSGDDALAGDDAADDGGDDAADDEEMEAVGTPLTFGDGDEQEDSVTAEFGDFNLEAPIGDEASAGEALAGDDLQTSDELEAGEVHADDDVGDGNNLHAGSEDPDDDGAQLDELPMMDLEDSGEEADPPPPGFGDFDLGLESPVADTDADAVEPGIPAIETDDGFDDGLDDDSDGEDGFGDLPTIDLEVDDEDADGDADGDQGTVTTPTVPGDLGPDPSPKPAAPQEPSAPRESVSDLRRRVDADANDADGWRLLGEALLAQGEEDEGLRALERAHPLLARSGRHRQAVDTLERIFQVKPDEIELHRRAVEYAHETDDRSLLVRAFLELGEALARLGERTKSDAVFERVLSLDPGNARAHQVLGRVVTPGRPAPPPQPTGNSAGAAQDETGQYVDLGSLVLDDDEEAGTRWVVVADEPTGDEQADFARMLSQFKEKVTRNLDKDDAKAHYDLGMAYKEMGLLDEAIGQFQLALKARPDDLPTIEMLGHCFLEQGEAQVAIRTLERGLGLPVSIEDELLGVYYFLGRAYQRIGNADSAKDFYEKIFALDINFEDVTERLRTLR